MERCSVLTTLFLDLNSYFASVEQQLRPELRGRPVGVVPMMADSTCCLAASYEAKAFGVKTGTGVAEARRLCPAMTFVEARPEQYIIMHHDIIAAVDTCLPVEAIHSIDEMHCRLLGTEREPERAIEIALRIKQAIYKRVGECMRCSIGIAPNRFLAKVATEIETPDGLVVIALNDLPHKLHSLELRDLPGIGPRMYDRLLRRGITSVAQLCALSEHELTAIWESVLGRVWYRQLRGEEVWQPPTIRRSIGHQHVLPPNLRTPERARGVLVRLLEKAAMRMRSLGYWARRLTVSIRMMDQGGWSVRRRFAPTQDTLQLLEVFASCWPEELPGKPLRVSVTLDELEPACNVSLPLFPQEQRRMRITQAMDAVNMRFGRAAVYPGSMHDFRKTAPTRILFQSIPDLNLPV